jgi:pimeloyl-ACP methyl ester carboxylesterase
MTTTLMAAAATLALLTAPAVAFQQDDGMKSALEEGAASAPAISDLAAPEDREGQYVRTDGARIFVERSGEGPAMMLLHGYPLSGALFSRVRDALDDEYTVITVDHRGYGKSRARGMTDSVETYARDAIAVMDELGIETAIIGGMSMGGPIVFSMYEMAPERFDGMVLIDTTAAKATPAEAGLWKGVDEVIASKGMKPIYPALLPDMLSGETRLNEPEVGEYLTSVMKQASKDAGRSGAQALANRPDRTEMLASIEVPTLVLVGIEDALYAMDVSKKMADDLPDGTLSIIPGASHAAVFENAEASAAAISSWAQASLTAN